MKIMYLVDNNLATIGGEQESTKIIIKGMVDNDLDIQLIQPGQRVEAVGDIAQPKVSTADRLKKVFRNPFSIIKYLISVLINVNKLTPDIIHTQAQVSFFTIALLRKLKLISKEIIFIHTERGIYSKYNSFVKFIFVFFIGELDSIVFTTEKNKTLWSNALRKRNYRLKYFVIQNTAGSNFFEFKAKEIIAKDLITIGFAGRYCDWKDWPLAEKIIEMILNQNKKINVKMAVGCLDNISTKLTKQMFSRLDKKLGLNFDGVVNLPPEQMMGFYNDIDFFILTSKPGTESFGRTVVEAMSAGCVVFVTEGGGPPEVVGNTNFVYSDIRSLVNSIVSLSNSNEEFKQISYRNIRRANEEFSMEANHSKHRELYFSFFDGA